MFQKGHKLAKGGKRQGAGRPKKIDELHLELEQQAFIREAFKDGAALGRHCRTRAFENDSLLAKYLENAVKTSDKTPAGRPVQVNVIVEGHVGVESQRNGRPILVIGGEGD